MSLLTFYDWKVMGHDIILLLLFIINRSIEEKRPIAAAVEASVLRVLECIGN